MEKYVLDTNLFFNMENGLGLGSKTEEVVVRLTKAMKEAKQAGSAEFFVPPSIVDEFLSFFEDKEQPFIKDFRSALTVKAPDLGAVQVPSTLLWQLVDDVRTRNFRGQAVAEEEIRQATKLMQSAEMSKKDSEIALGPVIKRFRTKYRQATRFGFLDSAADLELIILAKEIGGVLVSTDEGVIRWSRTFGIREMSAPVFGQKMTAL
jgi:RNA ligase partner protein